VSKKTVATLDKLEEELGVKFRNRSLLDAALLHRSYSTQHQIAEDNERLEFLGDSILNACVSSVLFNIFPEKNEGDLTKIRAKLVSRRAMREWGKELNIENSIFISEKMKQHMASRQTHIIENTMEAIIGALYLDRGFDTAYNFIKKYVLKQDFDQIVDFKSRLQEYTVGEYDSIPVYSVIDETGPPHNSRFTIQVSVNGKAYGTGTGSSKKMAEQAAAEVAYGKLAAGSKK